MELLEQLESQVQRLLEQITTLKTENAQIVDLRARCQELEAENKRMAEILEQEQANNKDILQRVDRLLNSLKAARESDNE